jgi:hypothetical protein
VRSYTGCAEVTVGDIFWSHIRIFPKSCFLVLIRVTALPGYETIRMPIIKYSFSRIQLCCVLMVLYQGVLVKFK